MHVDVSKRTLLVSQRGKIQLLPIHSKHMVLCPIGCTCTKLSSKILEREIIVNIIIKIFIAVLYGEMHGEWRGHFVKTAKNSITLTTSLLCYFSNW